MIEEITGNHKTTELIRKAHNTHKLIVCHSLEEVHRVFDTARKNKYKIHLPITYSDMVNRRYYGKYVDSLLIDNLDLFLKWITDNKIEVYTIRKDS